jgi:hypothetical protein
VVPPLCKDDLECLANDRYRTPTDNGLALLFRELVLDPRLRDAHAKSHGVLAGELRVLPGLPGHIAQGRFAEALAFR